MSTAGEIVEQAFREPNIIAVGASPTAPQEAEALTRLHSLVMSLFGNELGVLLRDWPVPEAWTAEQEQRHPLSPLSEDTSTAPWAYPPANSRLIVSLSTARTVYFPEQPSDGDRMALVDIGSGAITLTLSGNGRLIESATTLAGTPANLSGRVWIYRADTSNWLRLVDYSVDTAEMPLPEDFDDLFVTGLCLRLAGRFGIAAQGLDASIKERYSDMLARAVARYRPERPLSPAELRTVIRTTP